MSQFIEMFGDPVSWQTDTSLPTLNDTVNVISGFPFDSEKFDTEGVGTPLIRIRDIQRGYSETFTTEVFDEQYRIKKYELLVGMDGMFDIARWQSDEAALNQRVCCLRMKGSENDTFIQYLVQPILKHIENGTNATTVKHISTKQINGIRVPIASHEQKNKFAMIANQADKSGFVGFKSQFIEMFDFHELNLNSPSKDFESMCLDDTSSATKIPAAEYLQEGKYAVYDQAQEKDIAGYSNTEQGLCRNYPAVLFGDHSRVVKYINEPFFIGADGVKIIRPRKDNLIPEFLYYDLKYHNIPNTGYNRHFKYIKMISLTKASLEEQSQFLSIAHQVDKSGFELRKSIDAIDAVIKSLINS